MRTVENFPEVTKTKNPLVQETQNQGPGSDEGQEGEGGAHAGAATQQNGDNTTNHQENAQTGKRNLERQVGEP